MNELGMRLLWMAGQATVLVLVTLVFYVLVARRRPGAGAGTALSGLAGLIGISLLSLAPLPAWWTWQSLCRVAMAPESQAVQSGQEQLVRDARPSKADPRDRSSSASEPDPNGWSVQSLLEAWRKYHSRWQTRVGWFSRAGTIVSVCLFGALTLGTLRLVVAIWAVHRCRRRSVPIRDASFNGRLNDLRVQMRCRRNVEARESADLSGPATVGWHRPLLLLPACWRDWRPEERQAVLAHELAHICRGDYLAALVARLSVALHYYHPLVHWLAGRLLLQQELAADALAARFAGGRTSYLRALAKLVLQQDQQIPCWPARAFLPVRGTLIRRIAMLRTEEKGVRRLGVVTPVLLGIAVLGISAFRGPAQETTTPSRGAESQVLTIQKEEPKPARTDREPFGYCHLPPGAVGFYALRPSAWLKDPSMKKYSQLMNQCLELGLKPLSAPDAFPRVEELEQISGGVSFRYDEKAPEGQRHALLFSLSVFRTTTEFDWKKLIDSIAPKQTKLSIEGQTCYKVLLKDFKNSEALCGYLGLLPTTSDSQGERSICFLLPDKRTLIMGSESQFQEMLRSESQKPAWARSAAWRRAERGLFAVAFDNHDHCLTKAWGKADGWGKADEKWMQVPSLQVVIEKPDAIVFGVDHEGEFKFDAFALCRNDTDAVAVANAAMDLHQHVFEFEDPAGQAPPWLKKLMAEVSVGLEKTSDSLHGPTTAHVGAHVKAEWVELFESLGDAKVEASESAKP
jgi:beta-lactamase regulating signal transducer with metallopeptidase domain